LDGRAGEQLARGRDYKAGTGCGVPDAGNQIVLENYEVQPVLLTAVKREK
jgi:hypothetical protein